MKRIWPYFLAIVLFLVFITMGVLVFTNNVSFIDNNAYDRIIHHNDKLTFFLTNITEFGDAIILTIVTLLFLLINKERKYGFVVAINLILAFSISSISKLIFLRTRPDINVLIDINGYSFPSNHALVSVAFYGLLIYLIYKKVKNNNIKWLSIGLLSLLILLITYSRIYLGAHYTSDVISGFSLGLSYLILYIKLFVSKIVED